MDITLPIYTDETAAREHLEALRWPDGVSCPLCGGVDKVKALGGQSMGDGWFHCGDCRRKFTVRTGGVMERSHIALHKWVLATHLLCASKKGVSAHQLHRMINVTYKSAWFMAHRIRESMRNNSTNPLGGEGQIVEADETYIGKTEQRISPRRGDRPYKKKTNIGEKRIVISLVERGGNVRSFHVPRADKETVTRIVTENIARETKLFTDESKLYSGSDQRFAEHSTVNHYRKEYARGKVHTNTIEGYFSIFKRGMKGVYQHCGEKHLHRYLAEFDFRYNGRAITDFERAELAHKGAVGKRLTYRRTNRPQAV